jgi:hypothetical protein
MICSSFVHMEFGDWNYSCHLLLPFSLFKVTSIFRPRYFTCILKITFCMEKLRALKIYMLIFNILN